MEKENIFIILYFENYTKTNYLPKGSFIINCYFFIFELSPIVLTIKHFSGNLIKKPLMRFCEAVKESIGYLYPD